MSDALKTTVSAIEASTNKPAKWTGNSAKLVCNHDGAKNYNLAAKDGSDRVLLHCFSRNCDPKDILERAGLNISDIYHQKLNPEQAKKHKSIANDRQLRNEFEHELLILLCWISDSNKLLFPTGEHDGERTEQAISRVNKVTSHYIKDGLA